MANVAFLSTPASDAGSVSGGSWAASLPLANLRTQQPTEVARTTGLASTSTRFTVDMGAARPVGMFALVNHNLTGGSTVRFRLSNASDGSAPLIDVQGPGREPNVPFGTLPWGEFAWDGYAAEVAPGGNITMFRANTPQSGRYIVVEIFDAANPDGYVEIGRFMAGLPFVPRYNMGYGAALSFVDPSTKTRSIGGALWCDAKAKWRRLSVSFPAMDRVDALGRVYDLQNNLGVTRELLVVYDPGEIGGIRARRTLYGSLESLEPIVEDNPSVDAPFTTSITVEELI